MVTDRSEQRSRLQRLQGFLRTDPANRKLSQEAAELAMNCGALDEAAAILDEALAAHPDDASLRFQRGTLLLARKKWEDAIQVFEALADDGQQHSAIRYNIAYAQILNRQYTQARKTLDSYRASDWAATPEAHKLYAHACHHLDDVTAGVSHLETFLEERKGDAEGWGVLALLYLDSARLDRVEKPAELALALQADEPNALLALGSLWLERKDAKRALEYFEPLIAKHSQHGRAWSGCGFARMLELDLVGAHEAFERAVRFMPDHIGTWHGLAWLQLLKRDIAGAEASFNRAMELDRNFGETHGGLAVIAALQGRTDEADKLTRRALGLNKQSFAGNFARTLLLAKAGKGVEAGKLIERLMTASPGGGQTLQELAIQALAQARNKQGKKS